jgi:PAS domain S-box-containing protein
MILSLQKRIVLTLVPLLGLLLILGGAGVVLLYRLGTRVDAILRENYDSVIAMEHLGDALERIDSSFQFTLAGQEAKARIQYDANWEIYRTNLYAEQGNITVPGEKELVDELTALTERYKQKGEAFYARAADDPRRNADYFDAGGLLDTFTKIKSVAGRIASLNQDNMEEASRDAHQTAVRSLIGFAIGLAVCIALAAFGAWHIFHAVLGPIRAVTKSAQGISTGTFDQVVPYLSGDALGQLTEAFNHMSRHLREQHRSTEERTKELVQTTEALRTEISEREQMERELRKMAAIVASSDDAIVGQSLDGIITTWNKGAERIFGYSAKWIIGQPQSILVPPDHKNELPTIRAQIQRGDHVDRFETVRTTKDGQRIFVSLTVSPVHDETGKLIGVASIARDITERRRADEALRQASAYNRRLLEASLDPLVTIGPDGKITDVNAAAEAITGCSRSELVGTDFADYFTEPERARSGYQKVFSEGAVRDYPLEIRGRDGDVTSVLYNAAVFRNDVGKVVGVFAAARDITKRKHAEEEVRRLAQLQSAIAELGQRALRTESTAGLLDEAVGVVARNLEVDFCNVLELLPGGEELLLRSGVGWKEGLVGHTTIKAQGTQPGYVIRSECPVIVADAATETRFALLPQVLGENVLSAMSVVIATPEGPYGALGAHSRRRRTFTPDEVNFLQAVANVLGSAIQRKRAEEALRASEERTRMILDTANDPFITINARGEILDWNRQAESVFGWSRAEAMGRILSETIIPPHHREAHDRGLRDFLVTGNGPVLNTRIELTAQRRDGSEFPMELLVWPTRTGGILTISAFVRDITERKQAEERLRRSNRALVALSSCNETLIRATDETDLLQRICQIVVEKAGYRLCWVGYAEQDEGKTVRPVAQAGFEEGYLKTVNVTWADTERGQGPTGTCIRTGQTALVKNTATDPRFAHWRAEALKRGYASSIGIPLVSDSTPFGALTIYALEPEAFGDEEVKLLTELADDLAFGVMALRTKAERKTAVELQVAHEREAKIGSEIQQTLLVNPLPSDLHGLHVAALSVPSQHIDGDFYYFYKHEDQCVDLIVADVMGKGIPAALLGAATKNHFLEALCHLLDASPAGVLPKPKEIVTLAHAVMAQHLIDLESFVTLCYVRFDPKRCAIEFVDAGHTGLIHCKAATGRCEVLHGDNLPLGFRKGEIYNQQSVSFESDDLVVLFSDGVTEARNRADELFGEARLTHCIESNSALEPEDLVKAIRKAIFAFAESESPRDDLTCVVIKIVESERSQASANLEIRSDFPELGRAREFVRAFCRDFPGAKLDEEYVAKMELAVTEACSNIMKHAYHGRTDQQIHLEAEGFPDRISIRLYHLGEPFDPSNVPPPPFDGSKESGFGVYLITQSVDVVRYYRDERGRSCIALTKNR